MTAIPDSDSDSPARICSHAVPAELGERGAPWRSEMLFKGQPLIHIQHGEAVYQLRITAQNKLILTK